MTDPYDWTDDGLIPSHQWQAVNGARTILIEAGPFTSDADAAQQLSTRRKAMAGYEVTVLRDGETWEPGQ